MSVHVEHGVGSGDFEFEGKTVEQARAMLAQPLNIGPTAGAYVNGAAVASSYTLQEGDELEFVKPAGTKGDRVS